jgi:DNA-binding transcriptional MerR regulator
VRELEEYGLLEPRIEGRQRLYSETDVEIAVACDTLARFGIAARHLRAFRTAADRESGLLEALVAPALRSRNAERRRAGLEDLQKLAETAQELSQLLFARNVRRLADA